MIRAYKYRLRLRPGEDAPFLSAMEECRLLYNEELAQTLALFTPWLEASRAAKARGEKAEPLARYHWQGRSQTVTAWRESHPGLACLNRNCAVASTTKRLHGAWAAFWRNWKPGVAPGNAGIPRFVRYGAFGALIWETTGIRYWPATGENGTPEFRAHRIYLQPFGKLRLFDDRPLPVGAAIKTATLSREADGWYVSLVVEEATSPPDLRPGRGLGIDLGARHFVATSDGEFFALPDFYRESARRRRVIARTMARRLEGSRAEAQRRVAEIAASPDAAWNAEEEREQALREARRYRSGGFAEAREQLAREGQDTARRRKHYHIQIARALVANADVATLYIERLAVQDMTRKPRPKDGQTQQERAGEARRHAELAKSILNAGWREFVQVLKWQALQAGVAVVEVDPADTSQFCSHCGAKSLRWHPYWRPTFTCGACGVVVDSDVNAARNILARGESGAHEPPATSVGGEIPSAEAQIRAAGANVGQ